MAETYGIQGFNKSPLEREHVLDFVARLRDVYRKRQAEYETLQVRLVAYLPYLRTCVLCSNVQMTD